MSGKPFEPDWCLAPSACLLDWMQLNGLSTVALESAGPDVASDAALMLDVLNRQPLTATHAQALEYRTGISAGFWLRWEDDYRSGLTAGRTDVTPEDMREVPGEHHR